MAVGRQAGSQSKGAARDKAIHSQLPPRIYQKQSRVDQAGKASTAIKSDLHLPPTIRWTIKAEAPLLAFLSVFGHPTARTQGNETRLELRLESTTSLERQMGKKAGPCREG